MFYKKLNERIERSHSRLCVGLDVDLERLPKHLGKNKDAIFAFNKAIIEATAEFTAAYKINTAFYEALGSEGWDLMAEISALIPKEIISIADAKRADIGNTSAKYAEAFFEKLSFDSITVNPYMGYDSLEPFLSFMGKAVIVLVLTSNNGSQDIQFLKLENGTRIYEQVAQKVSAWHQSHENCLMVVGATHGEEIKAIRQIAKDIFFLIPGIGAQGGNLKRVLEHSGKNVLINSSRGIIYANSGKNFAEAAALEAKKLKDAINKELKQ